MSEIQSGSKDLLDTTDCLEAVGVFKGWKNFFFVIMLVGLLLLQASFWVVDRGCIAVSGQAGPALEQKAAPAGEPAVPATVDPNLRQPEPRETNEPQQPAGGGQEKRSQGEPNGVSSLSSPDSRIQLAVTWPSGNFMSGVTFENLAWLIRFLNAVLILAATLYCLTLLFGLKVSMHGRLGGINHISRAFFLSLILLVLLLPWQTVFGSMVCGALYAPDELAQSCSKDAQDIFDLVLYYLRFTGFGALILLLLIFSQIRSVRWAKAILRRLEII
ncbi:MAG: hypothetical protein A2Z25_05165 [Planctomycetes bacterium RBG_16_55_9]|nr:MAG: hypothetical protein A2Z25_05165 [Planctomycetes bacterium RBG_16_55_9]